MAERTIPSNLPVVPKELQRIPLVENQRGFAWISNKIAGVAEGKTNKEIASEVFLSDKTVKNYVSSILAKLNLQRRAQAAAFMVRHRPPGGE